MYRELMAVMVALPSDVRRTTYDGVLGLESEEEERNAFLSLLYSLFRTGCKLEGFCVSRNSLCFYYRVEGTERQVSEFRQRGLYDFDKRYVSSQACLRLLIKICDCGSTISKLEFKLNAESITIECTIAAANALVIEEIINGKGAF